MHFVYILLCSDGSFYCGYSNDPKRRLAVHMAGKASKCTRSRLPVELVYTEALKSKGEALSRERAIKKLTHQEKAKLVEKNKFSVQN